MAFQEETIMKCPRRVLVILIAILGALVCKNAVAAGSITMTITAYVDGQDVLIIRGNTLQWHHLDNDAVGRHDGANAPTTISTLLDGVPEMTNVNWIPDWPSPPPAALDFDCYSSIFASLNPPLPSANVTVTLTALQARGSVGITQIPTAANGNTIMVDFDDDAIVSAAFYTVQLTIIPNSTSTSTRTGVLSHIAAGGGWSTVITLVNNSSTSLPVTVALHNEDGSALSLPVTTTVQGVSQTSTTSSVNATINPKATLLISTGDGIASTAVGWADVLSSGSISGFAIFRQTPQSGSPSEGTVPLQATSPTTITLPYDDTGGFVMGVALTNLSTTSSAVTASIWDDNGNQLGTQNISIGGSGHTSFVLPTQIPMTAGKRGIVQFQSSGGLAGLGLRFSPFGTFTSVPTI